MFCCPEPLGQVERNSQLTENLVPCEAISLSLKSALLEKKTESKWVQRLQRNYGPTELSSITQPATCLWMTRASCMWLPVLPWWFIILLFTESQEQTTRKSVSIACVCPDTHKYPLLSADMWSLRVPLPARGCHNMLQLSSVYTYIYIYMYLRRGGESQPLLVGGCCEVVIVACHFGWCCCCLRWALCCFLIK